MIYVISKTTFGSYNVRDIQCNANWTGCPYSDYARIPESMVDGILATKGYCDITLNSAGTEVASYKARTIPSVPEECCGTNTVLSVNGAKANTNGEITLTPAQISAVPTSRTVNGKALSSNITLSASDVSARPNTWMPTASEVGARPASYTYASKNGGDCNSYVDETHLFVFNMANRPSAFNYGFFDVWRASGSGFSPNGAKPIIIQRFTNWQYTSPVWRISSDGGTSWGEWMYENPPLNGSVEYTTTERYLDKPVKTKLINCGTVAKGGTLSVPHNCNISVLVRAEIVAGRYSVPYLPNGDINSQYAITGYVNKDSVVVKNGSGNSDYTVYAQIWYTNT